MRLKAGFRDFGQKSYFFRTSDDMAAKEEKVVDLTKDEGEDKPKKMKQMRLPFAKIDKNVALAKMETEVMKTVEETKKRKLSVSSAEEEEKEAKPEDPPAKKQESSPSVMKVKVKMGSTKKKAKTSNSDEKRKSPRKRPSVDPENVSPVKKTVLEDSDVIEVEVEKNEMTKLVEVSAPVKVAIMEDSLIKSPPKTPAAAAKTPKTPKTPKESSGDKNLTPNQLAKTPKTPKESSGEKNLTPKQLARKAEFEKKREEKEKMKEEARLAREAEKAKKEAERKEKEAKKEAERKEKEAQKEQERLEKERQKKEKEEERLKKKKEKEEQKELEKKQKEEANKKKLEEKEKQDLQEKAKTEKLKANFANFFIVKKDTGSEKEKETTNEKVNGLNQFRIKKDMRLAPATRIPFPNDLKSHLDNNINANKKKSELYISSLKKGKFVHTQGKTWPVSTKKEDLDDDVEIIEDEDDDIGDEILEDNKEAKAVIVGKVFKKAKLLQFHDNQRPAYFGTWSKKSCKVGPRHPFGMDSEIFDYDYDSDDDWEEEEQGESLSDEEKDKEEDENEARDEKEEDDDDGFFVGHGVLDKDELKAADEDDEEAFDEELEIKKQKLKAQQFEEEYKKKKPTKLKPRVFGCFWNDPNSNDKDAELKIAYDQLIKILTPFKAVALVHSGAPTCIPTSISDPTMAVQESPSQQKGQSDKAGKSKALKQVPDDAMPDLIRLVHANANNKVFLAKEFVEFWSKSKEATLGLLPKSKVLQKIQEIADYQRSETLSRKCWLVKDEIFKSFGITKPDVPNKWDYILEQPNKTSSGTPSMTPVAGTPDAGGSKVPEVGPESTPKSERVSAPGVSSAKASPASLITRFTKVLSEEERLKALKDAAEKAEKAKIEAEKNKAEKAKLEAEKNKVLAAEKAKTEAAAKTSAKAVNILTPKRKGQTSQPTLVHLTKLEADKTKVQGAAEKPSKATKASEKAKEVNILTPKRKGQTSQPTLVDLTESPTKN